MPAEKRMEAAICVHASLVELHEHIGLRKSKPYGPKVNNTHAHNTILTCALQGAAILKNPSDNTFNLLLYAPITKKREFEVDITASFAFTILPSLYATFADEPNKK